MPFNKRREGLIGADWEWLIYDRTINRYLRMLVQAKVLDDIDHQYAHIDRMIGNTAELQIDRLLAIARERGIPALYVFYNHLADETRVPRETCGCHGCVACWGCSIALADVVKACLPDKTFDTLRTVSLPWLCLLCPRQPGAVAVAGTSAPLRAAEALERLHAQAQDAIPNFNVPLPAMDALVRREPPDYFRPILQLAHMDSPRAKTSLIQQVAAANPDIDGIVMLRDKPAVASDR